MTSVSLLDEYEKTLRKRRPESGERLDVLSENPLCYDFFQDAEEDKPWEHAEEWVPLLFAAWERTKEKLLPVFKTRKSRCSQDDMLHGVCCLIASFHWTMGEPVKSLNWEIITRKDFGARPMNWTERLEFILLKPTQYHCFIQLDELFTEMKKQFYKYIAINHKKATH
ncbi:YpoC family protein [Bacillus haynesii]|uniref:YpoC family protein n=1 Tax=Bacillus haynesii TaxID=1925021 RepID=UPI00398A9402